jgi:hypothetical protein
VRVAWNTKWLSLIIANSFRLTQPAASRLSHAREQDWIAQIKRFKRNDLGPKEPLAPRKLGFSVSFPEILEQGFLRLKN